MSGATGVAVGAKVTRTTWVAFAAVTAGTFVVNLDRTMAAVALPQIGADLGARGLDAVVTANLVAVAVASPGSGWLADRFGSRRVLIGALLGFVAASVLAALAPTLPALVAARAAQGASGGVTLSVTLAAIHAMFEPHQRARAFATQAAVVMVSPALGPIFGGYLSDLDWRATFVVLAVVGSVALGLSLRFVRGAPTATDDPAIDWPGWVLAGVAFPLVVMVTTFGNEWGWRSGRTVAAATVALVALALFVRRELRLDAPLVQLRALSNRTLRVTFLLEWIITVPYQSQFVLLPLELTSLGGVSPLRAGMMVTPSAVGTMLSLRPASRILERRGVRTNVIIGGVCLVVATAGLALAAPDTPLWVLSLIMLPHGVGGGFCLMPLLVAGLDAVPEQLVPQVSAMRIVNKLIAQAVGVSISVGILVALLGNSDLLEAARSDPAAAVRAYATVDWLLLIPAVGALVVAVRSGALGAPRSGGDRVLPS